MSWLDRFSVASAALGSAWGAALDLATSPFDDDEESFAEVVSNIGKLGLSSVNAVAQVGLGVGGGALEGASWLSENVVLEPLSTVVTAASLASSDTWLQQHGLSRWNGFFSGDTWSKARDIADVRSFGQSVVGMFATDDIVAEEAEFERMKDSFVFNAVSGTLDAAANIFLDPTIVGGKVVAAGKAVKRGFGAGHRAGDPWLQRQIAKRTNIGVGDIDPWDYAQSKAVDDFLDWAQNKTGRQIANHEAVKKSAYPSVIAGLLQETDKETGRLIIAHAYGSPKAFEELAKRRDDLAFRLARADNQVNFALQYEVSRSWRDRLPVPPIRRVTKPKEPEPEQLPLFDIGAFPEGKVGEKAKSGGVDEPEGLEPAAGFGGLPAGKQFAYPSIVGNLPKTVKGQYFIAPKTAAEGGPYWMKGPVDADSIKEMVPYFNSRAKAKAFREWEQLSIPGLPAKDEQWKAAKSWRQHNTTLGQTVDDWDESMSMRVMPWDRQATKWFLSYQRELSQKYGKELDLLNAAVGSGGESRGVWNAMIGQVIEPGNRQLMKADRTLAYDWETRSGVAERIIQPKGFGLPVRVIQAVPWHVARAFTEKRPPSWIDPNRGDSHAAFAAYLNSADIIDPHEKDQLLRRYMAAFDPADKKELLVRVEATAIRNMATKYGLSEEAAAAIAQRSISERNSVVQQLRKQQPNRYAADVAVTKERFPWEDYPIDDDLIPVTAPILETQEVNSIPLMDLQRYERVLKANAKTLRAFDRGAANIGEFMDRAYDVFNPLWSFSVLMRFGYTIRTLTDDMLRIWASLGAMSIMGNIHAGLKNMLTEDGQSWRTFDPSKGALGQRARNIRTGLARSYLGAAAAASPKDVAKVLRAEVDRMGRDIESVRKITDLGWTYRGRKFEAPYGGKAGVYRQVVGATHEAIARTSAQIIEQLRSDYAHWDVVNPGDANHLDSWVYAVNNQIAQSAIGKRFLEGWTGEQVERWLRTSAEGHAVRKKIGTAGRDPERLAGTVQAVVDQYVPILRDADDPMLLRRLALEGKLDAKTLEQVFPNPVDRPQVHGPTIDDNLYMGPLTKFRDSIVSTGFKWLSQIPSDKLMRHPTFRTLYQDSIRRQYDNLRRLRDDDLITGDDLKAMEHTARESALKGVQDLLYDVSTKSNAAHMARFVTSFFSAWEDSISKWSRLAMDKPQLLFIGTKIYEAPNEMNFGMTTDPDGNRVPRVQVVDEDGNVVKPEDSTVDGNERIVLRLPEWAKKVIPGAEDLGPLPIPKESLNLILQGNPWWLPGAGPLVQVPIGAIAKDQPTIKEVYEWATPYGAPDIADVMLPGWLKQSLKANAGLDDPTYANQYTQILLTEEYRIRKGERTRPGPVQFEKEIRARTDAAFKVRSYVRFFAPFTADFQSPYQFYIDQYRKLAEAHGDEADERFYEVYGDDLYLFTTALSKSNTGIRATDTAYLATKKYADLIAANPEYGALIIGPDLNKGGFNQYVHEAQFSQIVQPGTGLTSREHRTPLQALADNDRKLGWMKFQRYMGIVTNMETSGRYSRDQIAAARRAIVEFIGEDNEAWLDDYQNTDRAKIPNRIAFFEDLVREPKLINDPMRTDLRVLAEYLAVRRSYVDHLAALKKAGRASTLTARENAGLADQWRRIQDAFAGSDTRFGDLFWRYLSHDELQVA